MADHLRTGLTNVARDAIRFRREVGVEQEEAETDRWLSSRVLLEMIDATPVASGPNLVSFAKFTAAVEAMYVVEKLHPRTTLDALLHAALPALGLELTFDDEQVTGE